MEEEWKIASGRKECAVCGHKFEEGESLYSVLYEDDQELRRSDYCVACWSGRDEGAFSHWRTHVPLKNEPAPLPPMEVLLDLFRKFGETQQPRREQFRYVLALLLLRKRVLKLLRTERGPEGEVFVLEHGATGEVFYVPVPRLSPIEVESLSGELGKLLNARIGSSQGSRSDEGENRRPGVQDSG